MLPSPVYQVTIIPFRKRSGNRAAHPWKAIAQKRTAIRRFIDSADKSVQKNRLHEISVVTAPQPPA
jgi:hypothetical protein